MLQNYIISGNPAILFNKHPDLFSETSFHVPPSIIKKTANLLKVSGNFIKMVEVTAMSAPPAKS